MFINADHQVELFANGERSIAMDNQQIVQEADDEQPSKTSNQSSLIARPANPNSWFRKRLDQVRSEARKEIQLKSIRPLHEK